VPVWGATLTLRVRRGHLVQLGIARVSDALGRVDVTPRIESARAAQIAAK
jgi:hypothetical protein